MTREQKRLIRKQHKAKLRAQQYAAAAERKKEKGYKVAVVRPVKVNGYHSEKLKARRDKKAYQALYRQNAHNQLSKAEKIKKIKNRRGESKRELARLS